MISCTEMLLVTNISWVKNCIQLASTLYFANVTSNKYLVSQIIFCGYVSKYCGLSNDRVVFLRHHAAAFQ